VFGRKFLMITDDQETFEESLTRARHHFASTFSPGENCDTGHFQILQIFNLRPGRNLLLRDWIDVCLSYLY
jgi:hypothetical protein